MVALRQARHATWRPFGSPRTNPVQFALGTDTQHRTTAQTFMGASRDSTSGSPATLAYRLAAFSPNFPAYPSGHSRFGAACFDALRRVRAEREITRDYPDRLASRLVFVSDELNGVSIDNFTNPPRPYLPQTFTSI